MTLVTLPVSAEDVPPESVGVGLQTSTVSALLLGGTWLVCFCRFLNGLNHRVADKERILDCPLIREPDGQTQQRVDGRAV